MMQSQEWEKPHTITDNMKVILLMDKEWDQEFIFTITVLDIKEDGRIMLGDHSVWLTFLMVTHTKVNFFLAKSMEKVNTLTRMVLYLMVISKMG